jgi:hypothetical protein
MFHLPAPYSSCLPIDISQIDWSKNDVLQFMYDNFVQGQYYYNGGQWFDWTWNWTVSYSQSICIKMCFQKYLFDQCGKLILFFHSILTPDLNKHLVSIFML